MKRLKQLVLLLSISAGITSCNFNDYLADGYGNFEAIEITISAENNGKLMQFTAEEGMTINKGEFLGYIDSIPLFLKKEQLYIQKELIHSKSNAVLSQIKVLEAKLDLALKNEERIQNLIEDNAATQKQLDAIVGEIAVIRSSISSAEKQNAPVLNEYKSLDVQLEQLEDLMSKTKIVNPINGTIVSKYAQENELMNFGKPLYKIADLSTMELRVYLSEKQLSSISLSDKVTVKIDKEEDMKSYTGTISWISSKAEFTPKIIQTKEERVALVYAVKVLVNNDGGIKIGMPAEMWLNE